jgi:TolB-like protein/Tfp pilus assembly protein PilF
MQKEPSRAVFLSYASQDAGPAQRISEALRAAGIEVWFDRSELRGGDVWDQTIRRQIKTCTLFIPVISRHTHERREGYFRLEWKLAVDRSHLISATQAFLVPVAIDDTREDDEEVPERIREVHWTRLPDGETPPAFVEWIKGLLTGAMSPDPLARRAPASAAFPQAAAARGFGRYRMAVYAAVVAVAFALAYPAFQRLTGSKAGALASASIAVLPFANESGDASQQYFADGMSEDLITELGQFPGLKVIGRTSSFLFRDSKEDSRSIGAKLGVAHLLEGSVRKSGKLVRVSVELINTADSSMQWSDHYDRPYADLFALQDEITHAVTSALRSQLLPGKHAAAQGDRPPSGSLEAYDAVLQGQFYGLRGTEADFHKAIEYLTRAAQIDPRYALAWSSLADTWTYLGGDYLTGTAREQAYANAQQAADRALALSPDLAAAHLAKGTLLQLADFDWRGSEAEFRRALQLSPNDALAKFYLGRQRAIFGDPESAIEYTQQALVSEPLQPYWYGWLARYLMAVDRLNEAEWAIHRAMELQPAVAGRYQTLTLIEILRGHASAALSAARRETPGVARDGALALARQIGDDRGAADAALKTLIDEDATGSAYQIAEAYALRNDPTGVFEWLDRAWSTRDPDLRHLLFDPIILRYKGDPRFAMFCRKVGLPVAG